MKRLYTLVCSATTNPQGERVRGCGRGWQSETRTTACPSYGEIGEVRDVVKVYDLAELAS